MYGMWGYLTFLKLEFLICLHDLQIKWDGATKYSHQNRVSPWDIEGVGSSVSVTHRLSSSVSKRTKLCFPPSDLDTPILGRLHSMKLIQIHS
jgi:auxin response factor